MQLSIIHQIPLITLSSLPMPLLSRTFSDTMSDLGAIPLKKPLDIFPSPASIPVT